MSNTGSENTSDVGQDSLNKVEQPTKSVETPATEEESPAQEREQSPIILQLNLAFDRGDIRMAKRLLASVDESTLNEEDLRLIDKFKERLSFDPVELYLPIVLFVFWALIFWRTTH